VELAVLSGFPRNQTNDERKGRVIRAASFKAIKIEVSTVLHMFDYAQAFVYNAMKSDSFLRFRRTSAFVRIATQSLTRTNSSIGRSRVQTPKTKVTELLSKAFADASTLIDDQDSFIFIQDGAKSGTEIGTNITGSPTQSVIVTSHSGSGSATRRSSIAPKRRSYSYGNISTPESSPSTQPRLLSLFIGPHEGNPSNRSNHGSQSPSVRTRPPSQTELFSPSPKNRDSNAWLGRHSLQKRTSVPNISLHGGNKHRIVPTIFDDGDGEA